MDIHREIARGHSSGPIDTTTLAAIPLFRGVPMETLTPAMQVTRWRRHRQDTKIMGLDERDRTPILVEGLARAHGVIGKKDPTWCFFRPGEVIGIASPRPYLAAVAEIEALIDDTITYQMPRTAFTDLMRAEVGMAVDVAQQMAQHLGEAAEALDDVTGGDNLVQFAHFLGRLAATTPDGMLHFDETTLARWSGLPRSEASKARHELKRRGLMPIRILCWMRIAGSYPSRSPEASGRRGRGREHRCYWTTS